MAAPGNRSKTGQFQKGQSGNPRGRPKIDDRVKGMLRGATEEAVQLLIDTMRDPDMKPELRKACADTILDRVYGKATQPIDGEVDSTLVIRLAGELEEWSQ